MSQTITFPKPALSSVVMVRDHIADSAKEAMEKAAEWMEAGFIVRAYESQSGNEEDFTWVVEAYDPRE